MEGISSKRGKGYEYSTEFKAQVMRTVKAEGINAAHEQFHIPKQTLYRWRNVDEISTLSSDGKPLVNVDEGLDADISVEETAKNSVENTVGVSLTVEEKDSTILLCESEEAHNETQEETPPESSAGAPEENETTLQQLKMAMDRESRMKAARRTMGSYREREWESNVILRVENEKLREENKRLRKALMAFAEEHRD